MMYNAVISYWLRELSAIKISLNYTKHHEMFMISRVASKLLMQYFPTGTLGSHQYPKYLACGMLDGTHWLH
jgi:hypothetical protein